MLLDDYIQNFLIYLQTQRRYSERTVITYRKSLEKYLAMLAGDAQRSPNAQQATATKTAAPLESFSETNVKNFVWDMKIKQKLAPTSICEHLAALKSFGKYLVRSKILQKNPAEAVPMPKRPKRLVQFLGQKDLAEEKFSRKSAHDFCSNSFTARDCEFQNVKASAGTNYRQKKNLSESSVKATRNASFQLLTCSFLGSKNSGLLRLKPDTPQQLQATFS